MHFRRGTLVLFAALLYYFQGFSQNPTCIIYNTANSGLPDNFVPSLAIDQQGNKWIGTVYGGVAKFDNFNWTVFNSSNSGLSVYNTKAIHVDTANNKWFSSGWLGKIFKYDDNSWTVYDSASSNGVIWPGSGNQDILTGKNGELFVAGNGIRVFDGSQWSYLDSSMLNVVLDLALDTSGNLWISTLSAGFHYYDGNSLSSYTMANSQLPSNSITCVAVEESGVIWITNRYDGIVKIDGANWIIYNMSNTGLPSDSYNTVVIDTNNVKWFATGNGGTGWGNGIVKYDGTNWTTFDTINSCIPSSDIISFAVDFNNNLWMGTLSHGVVVFNENGVVLNTPEIDQEKGMVALFPNPVAGIMNLAFSPEDKITEIKIYDSCFREVYAVNNMDPVDAHQVDCSRLGSGLYFVVFKGQLEVLMAEKFVVSHE